MSKVHVFDDPLIQHKLTIMRQTTTGPKEFRELLEEISMLMVYEVTRDLPTIDVEIDTPICKTTQKMLAGKKLGIVPILRAGMGMLDAMLHVLPYAKVGVLGMQRNEETAEPIPYYAKVPPAKGEELAIVIDPMLATGGSACDAVAQLKKLGYKRIKCLHLISAPEGIAKFEREHPEVPVYVAAKDERLNSHFYIVPGLGDAGDRIFGTL